MLYISVVGKVQFLKRYLCNSDCKLQRWRPRERPWPRGHILKSLALASKPQVLGLGLEASRTALFFEQLKFLWKTPETSQKICENLFCFSHLEHRRSQGEGAGGPPTPQLKLYQ